MKTLSPPICRYQQLPYENMGLCQVWPWDIYPHTSLCLSKSCCFMVFDKSFIGFLLWSSFKPWVLRLFMAWIRWTNVTVINPGDWTQLAPQTIIRAFAENEIKLVNGQKPFLILLLCVNPAVSNAVNRQVPLEWCKAVLRVDEGTLMKRKGPICSTVWPTGKVKIPNGEVA